MGFLDDLTPPGPPARTCKVRTIADELDKTDRENLHAALADKRWTDTGLSNELTTRGLPISRDSITKHRKNLCSCSTT